MQSVLPLFILIFKSSHILPLESLQAGSCVLVTCPHHFQALVHFLAQQNIPGSLSTLPVLPRKTTEPWSAGGGGEQHRGAQVHVLSELSARSLGRTLQVSSQGPCWLPFLCGSWTPRRRPCPASTTAPCDPRAFLQE